MAETLSLMEFLQALLTDTELQDSFADDPQGTLAVHGLADLTPDDVHDALVLVQDNLTVDYALDFSAPAAPPPPPPAGDGHEAAVEYLARYLAGPQQTEAAEPWPALDPETAEPSAADAPAEVPDGSFGAGFDDEYGAGTAAASGDHGATGHLAGPIDPTDHGADAAADGQATGSDYELDALDDLDVLDDFADADAPDPGFGTDPG